MKVFNLTDIATAELQRQGLVGVGLRVGDQVIAPGGAAEVPDHLRAELAVQIARGVARIGDEGAGDPVVAPAPLTVPSPPPQPPVEFAADESAPNEAAGEVTDDAPTVETVEAAAADDPSEQGHRRRRKR